MVLKTMSFKKRELDCCQDDVDQDHDHDGHHRGNCMLFKDSVSLFKSRKLGEMKNNLNHQEEKDDDHHHLVAANSGPARPASELHKFYKSYGTGRNLADCAAVVEELWWKGRDFAALKRSSVSYFNSKKSETAVSRWARARVRAAKVGKGLSKNENAQKLAPAHWLEAIDPCHRYGHNLRRYYAVWFASESIQPFFYWLDIGDGKAVNLEDCPRTTLQGERIKYLGPKEREAHEVVMESGKLLYKRSRVYVDTPVDSKWIFVLSTSSKLYVGEKKKGLFQHSSFLSGAATIASGRLVAHNGILEALWPYSGHYRPTLENLIAFCSFLEDHHVDLTDVKKAPVDDDIPPIPRVPPKIPDQKKPNSDPTTDNNTPKRTSSIPTEAIGAKVLEENDEKINKTHIVEDHDHRQEELQVFVGVESNNPLIMPCKWNIGAGRRISCVEDYPTKLKLHALEHVNLSPKRVKPDSASLPIGCGTIAPPRPSPKIHLSSRLACIGRPSPRPSTALHISNSN